MKSRPRGPLSRCVNDCIKEARDLSLPKMAMVEKKVIFSLGDKIVLDGNTALEGRPFLSRMKSSKLLAIFVVTLGSGVEKAATEWMGKNEYLRGYLLDRIGSLAVDSLAENLERFLLRKHASRGLSASRRFSPGYSGWPIEEQFKLARVLDFGKAGVRLTKNCMMVPKKSISAVVAIGPRGSFPGMVPSCSACEMECSYRRGG